ncbi:histidine phosphatase family protein [Mesobacillus foraminis]|uniref:histidine phosphatase family protein n=1 Tax=Mesobacillus foraminis TaxID=279826 RepID=UPI000EF44870|nr:histidine phosphatase family protein [Mesobacillus foraminis]
MPKKIYVVRHCEAQGQPFESPLTEKGLSQADVLVQFFSNTEIDRIISSPFLRATQSIEPLSQERNIEIETDERLSERILSTKDLPDWYEKLQETFKDLELKFEGGESSQEAMNRIVNVVEEVLASGTENTVIVSHGNIISLLLKKYNCDFDFECWRNLSNPDVFQLTFIQDGVHLARLWKEDTLSKI